MVAYSQAARRLAHWGAERGRPVWVGILAQAAVILAAIGIGIAILYAAEVISGVRVLAMVVALAALAGLELVFERRGVAHHFDCRGDRLLRQRGAA